jgi:branched-subunit amino acid aminotransferase/4-amino-4-deoxychorismate lyase
MERIEVDGRSATLADVAHPALVNFGHYTSMQIRGHRVRGIQQHLDRLAVQTRELFDLELDTDQVRAWIRQAVTDSPDVAVRVNVFRRAPDGPVSVMVTVRPPYGPPSRPQRLRTVRYQRPVPHIKHVGSFGQIYYARLAAAQGYDDALLTADDGTISETTGANIGFLWRDRRAPSVVDGGVRWPDAPCLVGTAMALLGGERGPVRVADLPTVAGAFVANSTGIVPVGQIDGLTLPVDEELMRSVLDRHDALPWDQI